jgi:hypothetical protein
MTVKPDGSPPLTQAYEFEIATQTHARATDYRRDGPGVNLSPSGYMSSNTNGSLEIEEAWTEAGNRIEEQILMKFGSTKGKGKGIVAGYVAKEGEEGAITLKKNSDGHSYGWHIGYLFAIYPNLRPSGHVFCTLKKDTDANGHPCIKINVKGATLKRAKATEESGTPNAQASTETKTNKRTRGKGKTNPPPTENAPAKPEPAATTAAATDTAPAENQQPAAK